ncbi:hypothetical protein QFC21_002874 [Naganishia friedmannii]|uniref:Uncharacterized protein n=1 Tax=Naganishia friedmannii TaxID=89922 RepID=A0ACC2VST7_9TREE|nr:hypothetical protein QFC21_002874 [Naganishia friedmannii]
MASNPRLRAANISCGPTAEKNAIEHRSMTDLSSRTVAQLKEELQSKGVDVKGLKLKKDYIEKLQYVLEAESAGTGNGEDTRKPQEQGPSGDPVDSVKEVEADKDQEGKHVSPENHPLPVQDPESTPAEATAVTMKSNEVAEAIEDPTTAITKAEKDEQILGDADGDLAEKMEVAAEAGKQERIEEQGGSPDQPQTQSEQLTAAEIKEEGQVAVEAAEAPAPPIEASTTSDIDTSEQKMEQTTDLNKKTQDRDGADKRKRSADQDEGRDGKRSRISPAPEQKDAPIDVPMDELSTKPASAEPLPSKTPTHPLPETLSHVRYHATRALYISNLKRPLLTPDLKAWILEQGASDDVKEEDVLDEDAGIAGGVWLDGVKSHCYCIFRTVEIAISAATKIQGQIFPVDHGAALTVEFVPEGLVESLVSQEKVAWDNGRNKLVLEIKSVANDEWTKGTGYDGGDLSFELVPPKTGGGLGNLRPPPIPRPIELGGMAPTVPAFARPAPNIRPPPADAGWGARANRPEDTGGLQRTRTLPVLNYRESPKHAKAERSAERVGGRWERNSGGWGNQQRNTGQGNPGNNRDNGWGRPSTNGGW